MWLAKNWAYKMADGKFRSLVSFEGVWEWDWELEFMTATTSGLAKTFDHNYRCLRDGSWMSTFRKTRTSSACHITRNIDIQRTPYPTNNDPTERYMLWDVWLPGGVGWSRVHEASNAGGRDREDLKSDMAFTTFLKEPFLILVWRSLEISTNWKWIPHLLKWVARVKSVYK